MVIIDQRIAFIGGIDLVVGRYDDKYSRVCDLDGTIFPGNDYNNLVLGGTEYPMLQYSSQIPFIIIDLGILKSHNLTAEFNLVFLGTIPQSALLGNFYYSKCV